MDLQEDAGMLTSSEDTGDYMLPDSITFTLLGLHTIVVCVGVTGNAAILILFLLKKGHKTNAKRYLAAIAISDILLILWCEPFSVFSNLINHHWIFGEFMCSVVSFVQTSSVIQRSFTLVASSLERYHAIRWPLKKQTSSTAVISTIIAIWIVSLVLPVPVAIFSQIVFDKHDNVSGICLEVWPNDDYRRIFSVLLFLATYFFPLLVMASTFWCITRIMQKKPPGEQYDQLLRRRRHTRKKTIQVFLLAFCAYAVCWLPIHTITITGDVKPEIYESKTVHILWLFAQCLAVSNTAVHSIIVLASEKNLRKRLNFTPNGSRRESEATLQNSRKKLIKRSSTLSLEVQLPHKRKSSSFLLTEHRESIQLHERRKVLRRRSTFETWL